MAICTPTRLFSTVVFAVILVNAALVPGSEEKDAIETRACVPGGNTVPSTAACHTCCAKRCLILEPGPDGGAIVTTVSRLGPINAAGVPSKYAELPYFV